MRYLDQVHAALTGRCANSGVTVDVVAPGADLTATALVVVPVPAPGLAIARRPPSIAVRARPAATPSSPSTAASSTRTTASGSAATPARSATCSACRVEEFAPLLPGETVPLERGTRASLWTERLRATTPRSSTATSTARWRASRRVTRNAHGAGEAWYVATALDPTDLRDS